MENKSILLLSVVIGVLLALCYAGYYGYRQMWKKNSIGLPPEEFEYHTLAGFIFMLLSLTLIFILFPIFEFISNSCTYIGLLEGMQNGTLAFRVVSLGLGFSILKNIFILSHKTPWPKDKTDKIYSIIYIGSKKMYIYDFKLLELFQDMFFMVNVALFWGAGIIFYVDFKWLIIMSFILPYCISQWRAVVLIVPNSSKKKQQIIDSINILTNLMLGAIAFILIRNIWVKFIYVLISVLLLSLREMAKNRVLIRRNLEQYLISKENGL